MRNFPRTTVAACAAVLALGLSPGPATDAADAETSPMMTTVMTVRGKLLFWDALDQPLGGDWRAAVGKWEVVDGSVHGTEVSADHHAAAARHPIKFRDGVIQYSFKLDGAKWTSLSLNDAKGHVCRVLITPEGLSVRKDDHDKAGPDKAAVLQARQVAIEPGRWHTLLVEFRGPEMLARVDGEIVAFGSNDKIDVEKTNFGLIVSGTSVSFKDLALWDAGPNPDWPATRARLSRAAR